MATLAVRTALRSRTPLSSRTILTSPTLAASTTATHVRYAAALAHQPSPTQPSSDTDTQHHHDAHLVPVPRSLQPAPRIKPTHNVHTATIHITCFNPSIKHMTSFTHFLLHLLASLNIPHSLPASLPSSAQLVTTLKGPFVHKKAMQNFWRRTHRRAITVWDVETGNEATRPEDRWIAVEEMLRKELNDDFEVKIDKFSYEQVGWGKRLGKAELEQVDRPQPPPRSIQPPNALEATSTLAAAASSGTSEPSASEKLESAAERSHKERAAAGSHLSSPPLEPAPTSPNETRTERRPEAATQPDPPPQSTPSPQADLSQSARTHEPSASDEQSSSPSAGKLGSIASREHESRSAAASDPSSPSLSHHDSPSSSQAQNHPHRPDPRTGASHMAEGLQQQAEENAALAAQQLPAEHEAAEASAEAAHNMPTRNAPPVVVEVPDAAPAAGTGQLPEGSNAEGVDFQLGASRMAEGLAQQSAENAALAAEELPDEHAAAIDSASGKASEVSQKVGKADEGLAEERKGAESVASGLEAQADANARSARASLPEEARDADKRAEQEAAKDS